MTSLQSVPTTTTHHRDSLVKRANSLGGAGDLERRRHHQQRLSLKKKDEVPILKERMSLNQNRRDSKRDRKDLLRKKDCCVNQHFKGNKLRNNKDSQILQTVSNQHLQHNCFIMKENSINLQSQSNHQNHSITLKRQTFNNKDSENNSTDQNATHQLAAKRHGLSQVPQQIGIETVDPKQKNSDIARKAKKSRYSSVQRQLNLQNKQTVKCGKENTTVGIKDGRKTAHHKQSSLRIQPAKSSMKLIKLTAREDKIYTPHSSCTLNHPDQSVQHARLSLDAKACKRSQDRQYCRLSENVRSNYQERHSYSSNRKWEGDQEPTIQEFNGNLNVGSGYNYTSHQQHPSTLIYHQGEQVIIGNGSSTHNYNNYPAYTLPPSRLSLPFQPERQSILSNLVNKLNQHDQIRKIIERKQGWTHNSVITVVNHSSNGLMGYPSNCTVNSSHSQPVDISHTNYAYLSNNPVPNYLPSTSHAHQIGTPSVERLSQVHSARKSCLSIAPSMQHCASPQHCLIQQAPSNQPVQSNPFVSSYPSYPSVPLYPSIPPINNQPNPSSSAKLVMEAADQSFMEHIQETLRVFG